MLTRNRSRTKSPPSTPPSKDTPKDNLPDEITISYKTVMRRDVYGQGGEEHKWKAVIWKLLASLRNIDDEVVLNPHKQMLSMRNTFESFGKCDIDGVHTAIYAQAITEAMLLPAYNELWTDKDKTGGMDKDIEEALKY